MLTHRFLLTTGLAIWPALSPASSSTSAMESGRYAREYRSMTWSMEGAKLSSTAAESLEVVLSKDPQDLAARVRLIGWLGNSNILDHVSRARLNDHVQWLIDHRANEGTDFWQHLYAAMTIAGPEANVRAIESWRRQVNATPGSTPLLESAAAFLMFSDPKLALEFLARAAKLAPRDPRWSEKIAYAHLLRTNTADRELQYAEASAALKHYEQALALTSLDAEQYSNLYRHAAESAWLVDRNDKATRWAKLLLKNARAGEWWYNNARHEGYTILGLIAIDEGKLAEAGKNLMLSVDIDDKGTRIFSPSLALAAALQDRGEKAVVIEYLEALRDQANYKPEQFDEMIKAIRSGEMPQELKSERKKLSGRKPPKG